MAIAAATVFEVRTGGSDNNGGGVVTGASGTDRSQQDAAHATLSTASLVNATTTIIDVAAGDYTCTAADVGNILQITGGSATAGIYQITARSAQQWTLDRSCGTAGQTVVGAMGGAFASPGKAAAAVTVSGNLIWVKASTYVVTTATPGAAGPVDLLTGMVKAEGYATTRGDRAGRPILQRSSADGLGTFYLYTLGGNVGQRLIHFEADGGSNAGASGFSHVSGRDDLFDCIARNCDQAG